MEPQELSPRQIKLLQLKELCDRVINGASLDHHIIVEMYSHNNYFIPESYESSIGCSSCQARVKERVLGFYNHPDTQEEINQIPDINEKLKD